MGMFDTFKGTCPSCQKDFDSQTKQFDCLLSDFSVGDLISEKVGDYNLGLKESCYHCHARVVAVIRDGWFVGLEAFDPQNNNTTELEGYWGDVFSSESEKENTQKNFMDALERYAKEKKRD